MKNNKIILIIISIMFFLFNCTTSFEKPYIIIYKYPNKKSNNQCTYKYIDKNKQEHYFYDNENKYNIGDTIK